MDENNLILLPATALEDIGMLDAVTIMIGENGKATVRKAIAGDLYK